MNRHPPWQPAPKSSNHWRNGSGRKTSRNAAYSYNKPSAFFSNRIFHATPETWRAALILHEAAVSSNLFKQYWWRLTRKVERAKGLLGKATEENLVAMHGIAVAAHNLVATMGRLRSFYANETMRKTVSPELAVERSLSAPPVVYRQALSDGAAAGCPYSKATLFLLKLQDAKVRDFIFMSGTWSRCPAEQWIPALIAGTWKRAVGSI